MRILAISPHPDDSEIGCAGALTKAAREGHEVFLLVMTAGGEGGQAETRRAEQQKAAALMGVKELFWGAYEDTRLPTDSASIQFVEGVLERLGPDLILTNAPQDTHQDHRALAQIINSATRYVKNVLYYETPTSQDFAPTVFVDIGEVFDHKISALEAHASQMLKTNISGLSILDMARASAHFRGIQGRVSFAEGFMPLRLFLGL